MNRVPCERRRGAADLRAVFGALSEQWTAFLEARATLLRWEATALERDWVECFLDGRMDGHTKLLRIPAPCDRASLAMHGLVAARSISAALGRVRFDDRPRWSPPVIAGGVGGVEALALILRSFAAHAEGTWLTRLCLRLERPAPEMASDWMRSTETLLDVLCRLAPSTRVIVLDDPVLRDLAPLDRHPRVRAVQASLDIGRRIVALAASTGDVSSANAHARMLTVRVMVGVHEDRIDDAEWLAERLDTLTSQTGMHRHSVPVRLCLGAAHRAAARHEDALRCYWSAEAAAERATTDGDPHGPYLRIIAAFGVASAHLAAPLGLASAAAAYERTASLCRSHGDTRLELEAWRAASAAHEVAGDWSAAWRTASNAFALVAVLTEGERDVAALGALFDALRRLVRHRATRERRDDGDVRPKLVALVESTRAQGGDVGP